MCGGNWDVSCMAGAISDTREMQGGRGFAGIVKKSLCNLGPLWGSFFPC